METFSTLLAICAGNSLVAGGFPTQRPVTQSFDAFLDLHLNKWLSKQSWGLWFEMPSCPLWRHCNAELFTAHQLPLNVEFCATCLKIKCLVVDYHLNIKLCTEWTAHFYINCKGCPVMPVRWQCVGAVLCLWCKACQMAVCGWHFVPTRWCPWDGKVWVQFCTCEMTSHEVAALWNQLHVPGVTSGIISKPSVNSTSGKHWWYFVLCDLQWNQTQVTVWKRPIRVKINDFMSDVTLKFDI